MDTYSFEVPSKIIWTTHILMGIYFLVLGCYIIINKKIDLTDNFLKYNSIILIILGALAFFYHSHLYIYYTYG